MKPNPLHDTKFVDAARRYADADRSDPFAFDRAMTHLANDTASYANASGLAAYYDATATTETRHLPDGTEFQVTVYRNVHRP